MIKFYQYPNVQLVKAARFLDEHGVSYESIDMCNTHLQSKNSKS